MNVLASVQSLVTIPKYVYVVKIDPIFKLSAGMPVSGIDDTGAYTLTGHRWTAGATGNAPPPPVTVTDAVRGAVIEFDGTRGFNVLVPTGAQYTRTFWLYNRAYNNGNSITSVKHPIWFNQTSKLHISFGDFPGSSTPLVSDTTTRAVDTWVFYAATFDLNVGVFYVNGVAVGSATNVTASADDRLSLGMYQENTFLKGRMDEVRIYERALSAAEILALYNEQLLPKP